MATPAPVPNGPASTFSVSDFTTLLAIANDPKNPLSGKPITVVGVPNKTHITSSGNMRVTFKDADEDIGFELFCPGSVLKRMQEQFGGDNGKGIVGRKIAIDGIVTIYKGRPEIRIDSPKQIRLAD